jgi:hypothetical protein
MTYTQEQLELAVKEAANFAYEQGKLEAEQRIIKFLESMQFHPAKPHLDLIIERLRGGVA